MKKSFKGSAEQLLNCSTIQLFGKIRQSGVFLCFLFFAFCTPIFAQTHTSVPLENKIYNILEQAELRGFISSLSGARPYTQSVVISAINEILNSEKADKLKPDEREILERYLSEFLKPKDGLDWRRGGFYGEKNIGKSEQIISINAGAGAEIEGSAGVYIDGEQYYGTEIWLQAFLNGDIGKNISYGFNVAGGLAKAPRMTLGKYNTYYEGFESEKDSEFQNELITSYSEPLTHFPYSYKKRWDGSIFFLGSLSSFDEWPNAIAGGYSILAETTASFLENKFILRAGRLSHEWGTAPLGASLALNQMARPFLGIETEFNPVSWFGISSITGALEYYNTAGIKESSESFQNFYSATMLQFRYKNYVTFDFIDTVVWPKRFELGYMFPIINNFMYQNNIGDFDNMAMIFNLKVQYPGLGSVWGSFFMDEMNFLSDIEILDRQMFGWQVGVNLPLPVLSFTSIRLSYTKINPYAYTHNRNFNPWYGDLRMETAYTNNGESLGYYLPPNSDELLFRVQTMPTKNITAHLQYQMIRHGADFGPSAVDGSNLLSELAPEDRNNNPILKRFFLQDGAYQWLHIIKLGGEWTLAKIPVAFFGEVGTVISYFTNIAARANNADAWEEWKNEQPAEAKAYPYSVINTSEYPKSTGFVVKLGVRIFPK